MFILSTIVIWIRRTATNLLLIFPEMNNRYLSANHGGSAPDYIQAFFHPRHHEAFLSQLLCSFPSYVGKSKFRVKTNKQTKNTNTYCSVHQTAHTGGVFSKKMGVCVYRHRHTHTFQKGEESDGRKEGKIHSRTEKVFSKRIMEDKIGFRFIYSISERRVKWSYFFIFIRNRVDHEENLSMWLLRISNDLERSQLINLLSHLLRRAAIEIESNQTK